ncbi:MAG: GLUG motif-containing protein, partial [Christensenellales bacterium]
LANNTNIAGLVGCGGTCGSNYGTIENVNFISAYAANTASGFSFGGIAGVNTSTGIIRNCTSAMHITRINTTISDGGIVGDNKGSVISCSNTSFIYYQSLNAQKIGGIAGINESTGSISSYASESLFNHTEVHLESVTSVSSPDKGYLAIGRYIGENVNGGTYATYGYSGSSTSLEILYPNPSSLLKTDYIIGSDGNYKDIGKISN